MYLAQIVTNIIPALTVGIISYPIIAGYLYLTHPEMRKNGSH